jgi:hypothetical protein
MPRAKKFYLLTVSAVFLLGVAGLMLMKARQETPAKGEQESGAPAILHTVSTRTNASKVPDATRLAVETSYGKLPLSFEPNEGQTDPRVKFLSRAGNRTLWLTNHEAVLAVGRTARVSEVKAPKESEIVPAVLRMKFVGANANPQIAGEDKQAGTVNYFFGKPEQWRTKIPTYARVRYRSLYPGIDLVFYGNNRELEYDLVVSPGADPGRIRLAISGAEKLRIDGDGNLVLETPAGDVVQEKPKIYQRKGARLTAVAGHYVITSKDEVGFRLGSYDREAAVVIDPVLRYSTLLGGSGLDSGRSLAVDSSNRAVVVGIECSPNFPTIGGAKPPAPECSTFITKLNFAGSQMVFTSFLKDTISSPLGPRMTLDSADNVYVSGETAPSPTEFPITPNAFQKTFGGGDSDAFVSKLNSDGTALLYSTFLGGSDAEEGGGIAVDFSGNAYVTGRTSSKDFPTTAGVLQQDCKLEFNGTCLNAFVVKLNANGSMTVYSTFLGGTSFGTQAGLGMAVNGAGNAFVTGETDAGDFPTTAGSAQPVLGGSVDAFVAELSSSGSHLIYSTFLGGGSLDNGQAIALDQNGNAFVTGRTGSQNFPVKNAFQAQCAEICSTAFVAKLSPAGRLLYSTYLGKSFDQGADIAVTPGGQAYVAGTTSSALFPTTQTAFQRVPGGRGDVFLTKFSPTGAVIFSSYLGGNGEEFLPAVALDSDTNAYLTGTADSESPGPAGRFPVTPGAFQEIPGGGGDAFLAKVVSLCALSSVDRSVTICSPGDGSTVQSPVNIVAGTTDVTPVKLTQIYLDGKKIFEARLSALNVNLPIANGTHRLTVQAFDTNNVIFKKTIHMTVSSQAAPCALNPVNRTVTICSPADGATVQSPVNVVAGTTDTTPVKLMQIYLDGQKVFEVKSASLNTSLAMADGTHRLTVQAIDEANAIFKTTINITVSQ